MIVTTGRKSAEAPGEEQLLLPWLATGRLAAAEARRVRKALARDPVLAGDYAAVQEEYNETNLFHEALGAPSPRAKHNLFAAIEAEPPRMRKRHDAAAPRFAALSPRLMVFITGRSH